MSIIRLEEPRVMPKTPPKGFALFAFGFRPFYLVGALLAAIGVPLWIAVLAGGIPLQPVFPAMLWHGHEMLFGFVAAIIVGFLLTAGHNWTGLSTPTGAPLAALVGLWLAGRLAMFSDSPVLAAALDLAFLPVVAVVMARLVLRARSRRNYFVPVLLAALAAANAAVHAGAAGWFDIAPTTGLHAAVALVTLLETVIAGRIVPSFTASALRTVPWRHAGIDRTAIALTGVALAAWAFDVSPGLTGLLAGVAALFQLIRVWGWRPGATLGTPLLWILHVSHGWIIVALLCLALSAVGVMASTPVLHLLTVGATGGLIIAMITRTALGHTGRLLVAGRIEIACFWLMQMALALRVAPLLGLPPTTYRAFLMASSTAWMAVFVLYLWKYVPILIAPRVDGRPG